MQKTPALCASHALKNRKKGVANYGALRETRRQGREEAEGST